MRNFQKTVLPDADPYLLLRLIGEVTPESTARLIDAFLRFDADNLITGRSFQSLQRKEPQGCVRLRENGDKLVPSADTRPPVKIGNVPIKDEIHLTTALTAPAQIEVISGQERKRIDVPAGIHHLEVPFQAGRQYFALWRDGKQIASGEGTR